MKDETVIPKGYYCYTTLSVDKSTGRIKTKVCPYWSIREDKPYQMNGYCSFINAGDWEDDWCGLLWDQVKECGVNEPE